MPFYQAALEQIYFLTKIISVHIYIYREREFAFGLVLHFSFFAMLILILGKLACLSYPQLNYRVLFKGRRQSLLVVSSCHLSLVKGERWRDRKERGRHPDSGRHRCIVQWNWEGSCSDWDGKLRSRTADGGGQVQMFGWENGKVGWLGSSEELMNSLCWENVMGYK